MTETTTQEFMQTVADTAASAAKVATYGGGATSALGGLVLSSQVLAVLGLVVALAGFVANLYFNAHRRRLDLRRDRREEREHRARMSILTNGDD